MKVLVINTGSSSLKYQLFDMSDSKVLAKGICERISLERSFIKHSAITCDAYTKEIPMTNHKDALEIVLEALTDANTGVISDLNEISAVGHRVVHGAEKFADSYVITEEVIKALEECSELAPLHNPPNLTGIEACKEIMPNVPMVGVFDTAFHQTMPEHAYLYPLPYSYYKKYGIRKYGFHGTSHKYVAQRAAEILGKPFDSLKIITCHLGNGASVCAINNGKSVETSMGFTPLEGLGMGTRCGSIDPAIVTFLMDKENLSTKEVNEIMNKKSGVLGLSEFSSDFRDIELACDQGKPEAIRAMDVFTYRVKKYIGEYTAVLGGVDAIVFTAGLGENNGSVRAQCLEGLEYLGVKVDPELNNCRGIERDFSKADATVRTLVVPTNEELMIARETKRLLQN